MSAKRSWDIKPSGTSHAPSRASSTPQRTSPTRHSPELVRRSVPARREAVSRRAPARTSSVPLRQRRKVARRKMLGLGAIGIFVLGILCEVILWQPFLRVETVQADGPNAEQIQAFVLSELAGSHYLVVPKSSIFFVPQKELREHILKAFPDVQAVSISPSGLTTLSITTVERATAFWWCGNSFAMPQGSCFETDTDGHIFAPVVLDGSTASTSMLWVYAPLASSTEGTTSPLGNAVSNGTTISNMLRFVKAMKMLNADVSSVDMRGDEADLYTTAGTRITYVLGREQQAAALAATAFPTLNLNDGSLLYVDLRFDSKVFFKKKDSVK